MIKPLLLMAALFLGSGAAQSQSGSYGLLWLDLQPSDANVALDGRFLDAKVWLVSLPPGMHELEVGKPGCKPYVGHFDIESGQSLHLDVHLDLKEPTKDPTKDPDDSVSVDKPPFP